MNSNKLRLILFILAMALPWNGYGAVPRRIWLDGMMIDGKTVKMFFDSASADTTLSWAAVKRLGLKVDDPGTNGPGETAEYSYNLPLNWVEYSAAGHFCISDINPEYDGIMGWDLGSGLKTVQIDANKGELSHLWHAPWFGGGWSRFPIMTNYGVLDIEVPHEDGTKGIITIDTGNPFGLLLSSRLWRLWRETHPQVPITLRALFIEGHRYCREEALADRIQIGPLVLTNVPVAEIPPNSLVEDWGSSYDGNIGMAALNHMDAIADGPHNVVYLRVRNKPVPPYSYNRLGAYFIRTSGNTNEGNAFVVSNTPAYDAGIRNGDILRYVDGLPPWQWTNNWAFPFDQPAGTKIRFTLQRDGTNFETVATLRNILQPDDGSK